MCLILLAVEQHRDYPLIIIANRDEFYARPTKALHWWQDTPQVLAGRDLESGGSWFGMNRSGHLAAITNYREGGANHPQRPSRGLLVRDYLLQPERNWTELLARTGADYNGFNFLYGPWQDLTWFSNRGAGPQKITAGVHGLSNHLLDTPWPKVEKGKEALREALSHPFPAAAQLLELLHDASPAPDDRLPDTGISADWEKRLSPVFIRSETYGTRASTALMIHRNGEVALTERSWTPNGPFSDLRQTFKLS